MVADDGAQVERDTIRIGGRLSEALRPWIVM